jgi:hypothetical protein
MEVPVLYVGDLTGNTTQLYQDRFDLQFMEYNPPSIKELTTIQPSLRGRPGAAVWQRWQPLHWRGFYSPE